MAQAEASVVGECTRIEVKVVPSKPLNFELRRLSKMRLPSPTTFCH